MILFDIADVPTTRFCVLPLKPEIAMDADGFVACVVNLNMILIVLRERYKESRLVDLARGILLSRRCVVPPFA